MGKVVFQGGCNIAAGNGGNALIALSLIRFHGDDQLAIGEIQVGGGGAFIVAGDGAQLAFVVGFGLQQADVAGHAHLQGQATGKFQVGAQQGGGGH